MLGRVFVKTAGIGECELKVEKKGSVGGESPLFMTQGYHHQDYRGVKTAATQQY